MSHPRKPPKPRPPKNRARKALPEELARDAIAHEDATPEGKVTMPFRMILARQDAGALAARAIRDEKSLAMQCSFSAPPGS